MKEDWQPLSVRRGIREPLGLIEGIPPTLRTSLREWLQVRFDVYSHRGPFTAGPMVSIAIACGIVLKSSDRFVVFDQLVRECEADDDVYLEILDACLAASDWGAPTLRDILKAGNSAWTVSHGNRGLEGVTDPTASRAASLAWKPRDEASMELKEAWAKAYRVDGDASDSWDHSIKALEALLIPLVVGKKDKANLGSVAGELKANAAKWDFVLGDISVVESMIRLVWPNPDRHGGSDRRVPSIEEARAVVHVAVTIAQWARDGFITKS